MRLRPLSFPVAFLVVVANPCGLRAEPFPGFAANAAVPAVAA